MQTNITLPAVADAYHATPKIDAPPQPRQVGWRMRAWCEAVGVSRWQLLDWIDEGLVPASRIGRVQVRPGLTRSALTIILISPADFLARHRVQAGAPGNDQTGNFPVRCAE